MSGPLSRPVEMHHPSVSIGLQFFNNEKTLGRAIQSILNQSFEDWELIVHDDGSTDRSREIACRFTDPRIRLYADDLNRKRPARLNQSIGLARGEFYAIMDGDDVAYPDRILKQVQHLKKNPDVDLLGAQMIVTDATGRPVGRRHFPLTHQEICRNPSAGFPMAQPTFFGRTEWFRKHGYDARALAGVEDQDLLLRSHYESRFANISDILVGYREIGIDLGKILRARYHLSRSLIRYFHGRRNLAALFRAIAGQAAKATFDCIAVSSGLKYRMLRHRASSVTDEERREWAVVWETVHQGNKAPE
jgi:glycosyltransferase involved in cell wall biosynthesis